MPTVPKILYPSKIIYIEFHYTIFLKIRRTQTVVYKIIYGKIA